MSERLRTVLIYFSIGLNIAFIGGLIVIFLSYSPSQRGSWESRNGHGDFFQQRLNMGGQQWEELQSELRLFTREFRELHRQTQQLRSEKIQLLLADPENQEKFQIKQQKLGRLREQQSELLAQHLTDLSEALTAEQREKLIDYFNRSPQPPQQRRGRIHHKVD